MLFAFVAGAGTALSPCVLPILPAVLSAGVTGGRRRPLGVVTGLALSFTFATVALVYVIDALGLPDDIARTLAIVVLAGFGISLLVPPIGDRIEAFASRIAPGPARFRGEGFGSGLVVGASLGLVYAPCAGPILAGVITASAAQDFTAGRLAVALRYAIGSALVLYALLLGGRRLADRLAPVRGQVQAVMGALMICVAVLMATDADTRFQTAIADDLPAFLVNPTGEIEDERAVASELAAVSAHGGGSTEEAGAGELDQGAGPAAAGAGAGLHRHPVVVQHRRTARPLDIDELRGQVVLIDFWTYTCINCIRTLPYLKAWDASTATTASRSSACTRPSSRSSATPGNVADAIEQNGIALPGRPGQRLRHLVGLRQPVLAGQVPDRRRGPGPLRPLRRGGVRDDRARDPHAAAREGRRRARGGRRGQAPRRPIPPPAPPRPTSARRAPRAGRTARSARGPATSAGARARCDPTSSPTAASGRSTRRRRHRGAPRPAIDAEFEAEKVFLVLGSPARPRPGRGAAGRGADPATLRGRGRQRRRRDGHAASGSIGWSTCPRPAATASSCASSPGSRATPSPSARPGRLCDRSPGAG